MKYVPPSTIIIIPLKDILTSTGRYQVYNLRIKATPLKWINTLHFPPFICCIPMQIFSWTSPKSMDLFGNKPRCARNMVCSQWLKYPRSFLPGLQSWWEVMPVQMLSVGQRVGQSFTILPFCSHFYFTVADFSPARPAKWERTAPMLVDIYNLSKPWYFYSLLRPREVWWACFCDWLIILGMKSVIPKKGMSNHSFTFCFSWHLWGTWQVPFCHSLSHLTGLISSNLTPAMWQLRMPNHEANLPGSPPASHPQ